MLKGTQQLATWGTRSPHHPVLLKLLTGVAVDGAMDIVQPPHPPVLLKPRWSLGFWGKGCT